MWRTDRWLLMSITAAAPCFFGVGLATAVEAQNTAVVEGRVLNPTGAGIPNATVSLDGIGFRLTDDRGGFRFGSVPLRTYTLRVEGFGYEGMTLTADVEEDVDLDIRLEVAPFVLDSMVVEARVIEIEGRVWDPVQDIPVAAADIVSNQADPTQTSWGGRFTIRVAEGVPVRFTIRAFRYLPLDTLMVPAVDGENRFELEEDPLATRMIEVEIARMDERAGGLRAVTMPPLNRDELQRWRGATLRDILKSRFPDRRRRLKCVIVNEQDVGGPMLGPTLDTTFADEVERIEFLFRGGMMRVYTKEFMRTMLGSGIELRRPVFVEPPRGPPLCL